MPLVPLRDRDDEAEVGVDHQLLRRHVSPLDPFCERDLLLGREQGIAPHLVEKELEPVGRRRRQLSVRVVAFSGLASHAVVGHVDPTALELLVQLVDVVVGKVVRGEERLELGEVQASVSLTLLDQCGDVLRQLDPVRLQVVHLRGAHDAPPLARSSR